MTVAASRRTSVRTISQLRLSNRDVHSFSPVLCTDPRQADPCGVPDLLDGGAVHSEELAKQAGLHPLSTVQGAPRIDGVRCVPRVGAGTFANSEASSLFRDDRRPPQLRAVRDVGAVLEVGLPRSGIAWRREKRRTTMPSGRRYGSTFATTRKITRPSIADWPRSAKMSRPRLRRPTTGPA